MGTVSKNRGMSCVGVRKTGTTLIRVSTVMGTLYNVLFIMELMTDKDIWYMEQLSNGIDRMYMKDIHEWCRLHSIEYQTVFVYRKEYPLGANIWNTYSYLRWRVEKCLGAKISKREP